LLPYIFIFAVNKDYQKKIKSIIYKTMSYHSGINQKVLDQEFFTNTVAEDQPLTQTNLSIIANLRYVQNWVSQAIQPYLPVNNPNFTGTLTSSSGGSINLTNQNSALSVPTITSSTNFTAIPTIQNNPISTRQIGSIKMILTSITPANYLLCNGQSLPVATYQNLYNVIGNTYGGNSTTFNLPNFTSSFPIGANGQNNINCPVSNFATGNGESGATNTYLTSANFGGAASESPPILSIAPAHSHTITDVGHLHNTTLGDVIYPLVVPPPNSYNCALPRESTNTTVNTTGITINNTGTNIQDIDPISGLNGVNVCPPYLAVNFYICYQ
jgi:microcystin-dependent protein